MINVEAHATHSRMARIIITYIYVLLLYIVDNTGRHDIDFGSKGLINYLSLVSYEHLNESF